MSAIKSVNWALVWKRIVWTAIFFGFLSLVYLMSAGMASSQPVIFSVVMIAAIVASISFVYSKTSWEAFVIGCLCVLVHSFLEASFWSSAIEDINAQVVREKANADARDVVKEVRKQRYSNSAVGKSPEQIQAEIKALQTDVLWTRTASCVDATAKDSREFCRGYFKLTADLAAAKESSDLEATVWNSATSVESIGDQRNLAKGAIWISEVTGASVKDATNFMVLAIMLLIQFGLAFSLRIGWAHEKPQEARTAAKPSEATETPAKSITPVSAPPVHLPARSERKPIVPMIELPEFSSGAVTVTAREQSGEKNVSAADLLPSGIDPDGGTPANLPEIPDSSTDDEDTDPTNVVPLRSEHTTKAELRIKKSARRASEDSITRWLDACARILDDGERIERRWQPANKFYPHYVSFCTQRGETKMSKRRFSTVLRGECGLPKLRGADGKRKSAVMLFPLELVNHSAKRKVA